MKNFYIAITFLCAALIAFLVLIACALTDKPEEPQAVAPEIAGQWKSRARRFSGSCRAGICGSPATAKQIISGRTIK